MLEKIESMNLWNVVGALHSSKDILLYAKTPNGHVNAVFS